MCFNKIPGNVSRRRKPILKNIVIEDIGAEGNALARNNDMVIFVPMAIPGDIMDIQITRKHKKYMEGRPIAIHKYSEKRILPVCEHFSICGGCKWQHLPYPEQLYYKEKQIIDSLYRIGKVKALISEPIIGAENTFFYRNKLEYTFSNNKWFTREEINSGVKFNDYYSAGFHLPGMYDKVLDINKCWLQAEPGNKIRNFIREYGKANNLTFYNIKENSGFLRNLIIRNTSANELMVIVVLAEENKEATELLLNNIIKKFPGINSLLYAINQKKNDTLFDQEIIGFSGKDYIMEKLEDLEFKIGPKSFFQTNTEQALKLYSKVREYANLKGNEIVYDLYTGTGSIAIFLARQAAKIIGIESIPEAISDAEHNSVLNGIENTQFFSGDVKNILNADFIRNYGHPDLIITDPPRAGMHNDVVKSIIDVSPQRIIYVSCNPATQARDIALLANIYKVCKIQPIDMFPHTHHVENIALLEKRI